MIAEQTGNSDPDANELRVMAEDERRELQHEINDLEVTVTVRTIVRPLPRTLGPCTVSHWCSHSTVIVLRSSTAAHAPA